MLPSVVSAAQKILFLVIFSVILVGISLDLVNDAGGGATASHLLIEAAVVLLSLFAVCFLAWSLHRESKQTRLLSEQLEAAKASAGEPGPEVLAARQQLQEAIATQFDHWQLTPSEREVGLLLLKGLSLSEIAALRETREKTVRQQASSIYAKSGLAGRHAFAAWFFEDLL